MGGNIQFPAHKDLIGVDFADGKTGISRAFRLFSCKFFHCRDDFSIELLSLFFDEFSLNFKVFEKLLT
jgi:hypothetical protein